MSEAILEMQNVEKRFGGVRAIDQFSLKVEPGMIYGLIGPNGAGKTTIFNTITGIYQADGGRILFQGKNITKIEPHEAAHLGIARTFQNIRLFGNLSVKTNVMISCNMHSKYHLGDALLRTPRYREATKETEDCAMEFLDIVGLADKGEERASSLPYGHQRKLEIARAMATDPKLLLLDEPAAGMNPTETAELLSCINTIRDTFHVAILLIEHDMSLVMRVCERIQVINFGQTIAAGLPEEIASNQEVIEAYLGEEEADDDAED